MNGIGNEATDKNHFSNYQNRVVRVFESLSFGLNQNRTISDDLPQDEKTVNRQAEIFKRNYFSSTFYCN